MALTGAIVGSGIIPDVVPRSWLERWLSPPADHRPLQIVHGIAPDGKGPAGMAQMVPGAGSDSAIESGMRRYRDLGLGGIVCNVMFKDYMRSEPAWDALVQAVRACRDLGLVAWIYDEDGYPSGAAGGLVLEGNPEFEALELARDTAAAQPFIVRPAYEFTHASNNYYAARRYVNLLDDRAVRKFVSVTHEAYRRRLGAELGGTVKAFFTDEPSLITVNLGEIPESARRNVPIRDPPDPAAKPLPAVPWAYDLSERYRERYGADLLDVRRSLFEGDTDGDRTVRRRYWALIADLVAERYFGGIQRWCAGAHVASSGHILWEEALMHHPALYGNALKALSRMDVPGLDELSSDPSAVLHGHWMTAALPASAAMLTGGRRVFTEVSDFSEKMSGTGPASLARMQATAAWQAAMGVTDFTLYYGIADRSAEDYRAYCDYVGRLNAVLKEARLDPDVLLYYPIHDLWAEYRPVADPLNLGSQTQRAQKLVGSFNATGTALTHAQVPFCLTDHEFLAKASVRSGRLQIRGHGFRAIVLPEGAELPEAASRRLAQFESGGGIVLRDGPEGRITSQTLRRDLRPDYALAPEHDGIVLGRFVRERRPIIVIVNAGASPYAGTLSVARAGLWTIMDPATASVRTSSVVDGGAGVAISLAASQAVILVGPPARR